MTTAQRVVNKSIFVGVIDVGKELTGDSDGGANIDQIEHLITQVDVKVDNLSASLTQAVETAVQQVTNSVQITPPPGMSATDLQALATEVANLIAEINQAKLDISQLGTPGGIATLDTNTGTVPIEQVPEQALTSAIVVASSESLTEISGVAKGNLAVVAGPPRQIWLLNGRDSSQAENWINLLTLDQDDGVVSGYVKVSESDVPFFLSDKVIAGSNITIDTVDLGGNNYALRISSFGGGDIGQNVPPILNTIPAQNLVVGQAYLFNLSAYVMMTDGDPVLEYQIVSGDLPEGITFSTASGVISGTPTGVGSVIATFAAIDKDGMSNTQSITFTSVNQTAPAANYDYGTFDTPNLSATLVDFGTFDSPTSQQSIDFGSIA